MARRTTAAFVMVAAFAFTTLPGCTTREEVAEQSAPTAETAQTDLPPEVAVELATLSESDRALAIKQRICPVAEKLLGSMGQPIKLSVEGREVFICCEGCEEKLRSNPDQYFEKIDNQSL